MGKTTTGAALTFRPATPDRWPDLARLFGKNGVCAGCWCMWWKVPHARWQAQKGRGNRAGLRRAVGSGEVPGILAYRGREPVGWCAIEPRRAYPRLARSRVLAPVDDRDVWSITCFFVARSHRRRGVSRGLIEAAVARARRRGAALVEAYPVDPRKDAVPDVFVYTGLASAFRRAGFVEVARRSETRPIMRRATDGPVARRRVQAGAAHAEPQPPE